MNKCRRRNGRVYGVSVGKCVGVWGGEGKGMRGVGKVRGDRGVKKCGMYNDVKKQFFCTCFFFLPRFFYVFLFFLFIPS